MSIFEQFLNALKGKKEKPEIIWRDKNGQIMTLVPTKRPDELTIVELTLMTDQAEQWRDFCFAEMQRRGYWMSKDLTYQRINMMDASHIWAILQMWQRRAKSQAAEAHTTCWQGYVQELPAYGPMMTRATALNLPISDFHAPLNAIDTSDWDDDAPDWDDN